jgi:hypothetical protein
MRLWKDLLRQFEMKIKLTSVLFSITWYFLFKIESIIIFFYVTSRVHSMKTSTRLTIRFRTTSRLKKQNKNNVSSGLIQCVYFIDFVNVKDMKKNIIQYPFF